MVFEGIILIREPSLYSCTFSLYIFNFLVGSCIVRKILAPPLSPPTARSPLFSHISTTIQGLPTIRTFGKKGVALDLFHHYQNEHSKGWYLYLITAYWLGQRVDTLGAGFLAAVAFVAIALASSEREGGREWERGREGGREREREGGREEEREEGNGREGEREGGREREKGEGEREGGREEERGREGGRQGGKGEREGGRREFDSPPSCCSKYR